MDKGIRLFAALTALTAVGWAGPAFATTCPETPEQSETNPETGHFFEVYSADEISWADAKACADSKVDLSGVPGHLATITSSSEDAWIDNLRNESGLGQVWVGGFQAPGSPEPGGGWRWENDEGPFPGVNNDPVLLGYANWAATEPNNNGGSENHLALGRYGLGGGWNDEGSAPGSIDGFIVEYDVPRTAECTVGLDCETINGQTLVFPTGSFQTGDTIKFTAFEFTDPRVDANGKCSINRGPLTLFTDVAAFGPDAQLRIPPYLCGSPKFVVVAVDSSQLDIQNGTVQVENQTTEVVLPGNKYNCFDPIIGSALEGVDPLYSKDPQYQDVVVWQSTDPTRMLENQYGTGDFQGAATEATNACGSSRAKVRGASYFVVGMHVDFGPGYELSSNSLANYGRFVSLTRYKLTLLRKSIAEARAAGSLRPVTSRAMDALIALAIYRLDRGSPAKALIHVKQFLWLANAANYTSIAGENYNGDHLMRGENIAFMLRVKVIPYPVSP
ncbi:MAG: hypothetical protein IPJ97_03815 [Proteobacteria bacterium]|nr:hypothetical protein [Pseudomonadota bacterium]